MGPIIDLNFYILVKVQAHVSPIINRHSRVRSIEGSRVGSREILFCERVLHEVNKATRTLDPCFLNPQAIILVRLAID